MPSCKPGAISEPTTAVFSAIQANPRGGSNFTAPSVTTVATRETAMRGGERAYSPIVLAGIVRIVEVALVAMVGFGLYLWFAPSGGDFARYLAYIAATSLLSLFAFQITGVYQLRAFRGQERPYVRLISAWSVAFLIAIPRVFASLARQLLRGRISDPDRVPAHTIYPGLPVDTARAIRTPHCGNRRRQ
jgi:hypothetical protein